MNCSVALCYARLNAIKMSLDGWTIVGSCVPKSWTRFSFKLKFQNKYKVNTQRDVILPSQANSNQNKTLRMNNNKLFKWLLTMKTSFILCVHWLGMLAKMLSVDHPSCWLTPRTDAHFHVLQCHRIVIGIHLQYEYELTIQLMTGNCVCFCQRKIFV